MKLRDIDYFAQTKTSFFHNLSTKIKLWSVLIIVVLSLFNQNYKVMIGVYLVLLSSILFSKIQKRELLLLSMYPLVFMIFYVFSLKNISLNYILLVVFRVLTITTTLVTLIFSTPYNKIFAQLDKFLPASVVKITFACYRSLFILAEELDSMLLSLKLRGGNKKNELKNLGNLLGLLFINTFENSEKMYESLKVRGYLSRNG